jgi:hypothetical protein
MANQKIVSVNQALIDFAWREDPEKGGKKAAGCHADATNASNIVAFTL